MSDNFIPKPAPKKRWIFGFLFLIFISAGLAWGWWWYTVLRFEENTDDAYVAGNLVQIVAQVTGIVQAIAVDDTQVVQEGDLLITLDSTDAQIAFETAQHKLAETVRTISKSMADLKQLDALIEIRLIAVQQMEDNLKRRQVLGTKNAVGKEELFNARNSFLTAQSALRQTQAERAALETLVLQSSITEQPGVQLAITKVRESWLALQRTKIVSPVSGQVVKRSIQVGNQVRPDRPLLTIVPLDNLWVDANFKEVQLRKLKIGQPAVITVDMYGTQVQYTGEVMGFAAGTGSIFSLLPPQNATGNWIKIVQRVPVRISLNAKQLKDHPLLIGLSSLVKVDIAHPGQALTQGQFSGLQTKVLQMDFSDVNTLIKKIISENHASTGKNS